MVAPAIPIAIGAVVLGGIALRLRALSQAKVPAAPPSPPAVGPVVPAAPPAVAAALPALLTNPDGSDHTQGTPFIFNTNTDAQKAVEEANRRGISVQQLLLEKSGQLTKTGDGAAVAGQKAIVTTNDPAPAGDLIIRSSAGAGAPQIGGADKNGTVTILDSSDATFALIDWPGGRHPAAKGFARKAFLKLV